MYFHFNLFWSYVTYLYQNIKGGIGGIEMKHWAITGSSSIMHQITHWFLQLVHMGCKRETNAQRESMI